MREEGRDKWTDEGREGVCKQISQRVSKGICVKARNLRTVHNRQSSYLRFPNQLLSNRLYSVETVT